VRKGNLNAPRAVTMSAVIYCLRCLVRREIPLNQGCLNPVEVIIPEGSILAPSEEAGVVGGNVLTSQRVTDVILTAFKACANSQVPSPARVCGGACAVARVRVRSRVCGELISGLLAWPAGRAA
jgi:N-methylhydantoinase B/oxoprolinase/acetone carboxylase alpha subunit